MQVPQLKPGSIVAFCGLLGSGKTLAMTFFALQQQDREVRANYDTRDFFRLETMHQLFNSQDCVLCIDEIQNLLDSRAFSKNQLITHWLVLIRKLGVTLFYTTQHINQVDLRLRQLTNYIFWCRHHVDGYSKIDVLAYGGADEATVLTSFIMPQQPMYGLYNTKDMRVALSEERDGKAYCPFPFEDYSQPTTVPPVRVAGGGDIPKKPISFQPRGPNKSKIYK